MQVLSRTAASFVMAWLASAPMDLPHHHSSCWAGEPSAEVRAFTQRIEGVEPSVEAQANLRRAFTAQREGLPAPAEVAFSDAIKEWSLQRSTGRRARCHLQAARHRSPAAGQAAGTPVRTFLRPSSWQRAAPHRPSRDPADRLCFAHGSRKGLSEWRAAERDLTAAIERLDDLDAIEATNPSSLPSAATHTQSLGNYVSASEDALRAEADFKAIGDRIRRLLSASDAALALYGAGDYPGAVERMCSSSRTRACRPPTTPTTSRCCKSCLGRMRELHLAYAGHLFAAEGKVQQAATQWESGCIRLEAYVQGRGASEGRGRTAPGGAAPRDEQRAERDAPCQ